MLNKKQFDILTYLEEDGGLPSQREIAKETNISVGTVNKLLNELIAMGLVDNKHITKKGIEELEPFKVKRAVIMAAGFGSRMVPITLNTPKPLVHVNGVRIIEPILDRLTELGIKEIYLVRGYLATQFDDLLYKYPNIKFIENTIYKESNNISSVVCAKQHLQNAYVLEADLLLYNKKIIKKYQYSSNYLAIPVEKTDDWCLYQKDNYISKVEVGGENCFKLVGISYWTKEDGIKLCADIESVFTSPGGRERFWDLVPLTYCKNNYKVSIRTCKEEDIIEIDTFNELKAIDPSYDV